MSSLDQRRVRAAVKRALRRAEPPAQPAQPDPIPPATSPADRAILERAYYLTMTGSARLQALVDAVRYVHARGVPGAFAECGVWLGGSVLAMLLTLQDEGAPERDVWLYDTFEGMTEPTEVDTSPFEPSAGATWRAAQSEGRQPWDYWFQPETFSEDGVRATLLESGYPADRLHFVRGRVEDTIPKRTPHQLALLRLDTDWYESTRWELEHLYPLLAPGGVLIVDDYGHWDGARRAVDEYFSDRPVLLNRIDYSARIAVKA